MGRTLGSRNKSPASTAADIAAALMWGPKSIAELRAIVAPTSNDFRGLLKYVEQYEAAGCAYLCSVNGRGKPVYGWNTKPFENESIAMPGETTKAP